MENTGYPGSLICCTYPQAKKLSVVFNKTPAVSLSAISNQEKLFPYHDKSKNISSIPEILKIYDFLECVEQKNHEQVSKFNYRMKTIYFP